MEVNEHTTTPTTLPVPICTKCETPYLLRVAFVGTGLRHQWVYGPDCKCKVPATLADYSPLPTPVEKAP